MWAADLTSKVNAFLSENWTWSRAPDTGEHANPADEGREKSRSRLPKLVRIKTVRAGLPAEARENQNRVRWPASRSS
jgi:hypothetical protein